jgi:Putative Actinobacterial Holin-X, holin superfamily III
MLQMQVILIQKFKITCICFKQKGLISKFDIENRNRIKFKLMEEKYKMFEELVSSAETYGKTNVELIKLKTVDKVADGVSSMVAWAVVAIALILFFITLNFGVALLFGELLGSSYIGFLIVAAFYGLLGLILYLNKDKWIKKPLNISLINNMLK